MFYEVWADVIMSFKYEVEANSKEEAIRKVSSEDVTEQRRIRSTTPVVTSINELGD